jgi:hypothetical protein
MAQTVSGREHRVLFECAQGCDNAYTQRQVDAERTPACGRCGGPLNRLDLLVVGKGLAP